MRYQIASKKSIAFLFAIHMFIVMSCEKKELQVPPADPGSQNAIRASFASASLAFAESINEVNVPVGLSSVTEKDETIIFTVTTTTAEYGKDFITVPATVDGRIQVGVPKGDRSVNLKIVPLNNDRKDGSREFRIDISKYGSIKTGSVSQLQVTVADDDARPLVSFTQAKAALDERQQDGITAEVLVTATPITGYVEIGFESGDAQYGRHFITEPAMVSGRVRLTFEAGKDRVKFVVKPVDDDRALGRKELRFTLLEASQEITIGQQRQLLVELTDDDSPAITSLPIGTLRRSYTGGEMYILTDQWITGTVSSTNDNLASSVAFIQDASGGIALRFNTSQSFQPGEMVSVNIHGSVVKDVNGVLEIRQLNTEAVTRMGLEILDVPILTLSQLHGVAAAKEGQIITVSGVSFPEADGSATLEGDRVITDGDFVAHVRTESFASFRNTIIPSGRISVTGVLIEDRGHLIIIPMSAGAIR